MTKDPPTITGSRDTPPWDFDPLHLQHLGELVVAYGRLDTAVSVVLMGFLLTADSQRYTAAEAVTVGEDIRWKLEKIKAVTSRLDSAAAAPVLDWVSKVSAAQQERNGLVHSTYLSSARPDALSRLRITTRGEFKVAKPDVLLEDVRRLVVAMNDLAVGALDVVAHLERDGLWTRLG